MRILFFFLILFIILNSLSGQTIQKTTNSRINSNCIDNVTALNTALSNAEAGDIIPNPFSQSTTIQYFIREPSIVSLYLVSLTGKIVQLFEQKDIFNNQNDQDAIRVGYSGSSLSNSNSLVYNNYFYDWEGEIEEKQEGIYTLNLNFSNIPTGMYFIHININRNLYVKKVIIK